MFKEGFSLKPEKELETQVEEVKKDLSTEIVQPSTRGDIFSMPIEEIKEKFPLRYKIYLNFLRKKRQGEEITEGEKKEAKIWITVLNNLDRYIENHYNNENSTLREKQIGVFEDMRDFLEEGEKDGYIKMPTGSGKTVIFSEFIEAIGLKTLIVVPTKILVNQTEEKLSQFAEELDVGKIYQDAKKQGKDVTIITYDSLVRKIKNKSLNPEDYKCLILDEAHNSLSDKRIDAVEKFKGAIRIGFSATPKYSETKSVENLLNREIHNISIREGVEEGMMSSLSAILAETDVDISDIRINSTGNYDEKDLEKAINIESRNRAAISLYKEMFMDQYAVVYCSGINHAKNIASLFNEEGINAEVISGKQDSKEQEDILKRFKNGEIKVLCNSDILIAGFDEPKASVCLNLRPTLSPVVAEQRGGRVLRLDPDNSEKHATIVDFIDKDERRNGSQITFAEIVDGSVIYPKKHSNYGGGGGEEEKEDMKIEGLKVIVNPNEVMRIISNNREIRIKEAPEGWMTITGLSKKIGKGHRLIKIRTEKYKETNPEYFKEYLDKRGRVTEHISPELVKIIEEELGENEEAPEGWMTINGLSEKTGRSFRPIKSRLEKYRETNPEYFKEYLDKRGRVTEHISPELVKIIEEELREREEAPEGWMTITGLSEKLGRTRDFIIPKLEKYKETNSEWFKPYLDKRGGISEHISPELVKITEEELGENEEAPEGWMTINGLSEKTGRSFTFIESRLEKYKETNPEYFKEYLGESGKISEHISPELIKILKEELKNK